MKFKKFFNTKLVSIHRQCLCFVLFGLIILSFSAKGQTWSLQQCIDTALVNNKNLQISRNNIELSTERQGEAKANLLPKINLSADYKYFFDLPYQLMPQSAFGGNEGQFKEMQMGVPHNISTSIQLTLPLYNPQIYGGIKSTQIAVELNELQYEKSEEEILFEISNIYYNAQILLHQQHLIEGNLANTQKLRKNLDLLYTQQMIKRSDVTKVVLQEEQLETQLELVNSNYKQVLNALKFLVGISFQDDMLIEREIKFDVPAAYTHLSIVDLELALTQKELLKSELQTLKNSRLPTVSLFGSYGQNGFGYNEEPNEFLEFFPSSFAGLQLTVPIFSRTVTQRKIKQKKIEIENSRLQLQNIAEQNNMLVENARRKRLVTKQTIDNTLNQIDLAETVYHDMLLQQKEGTSSLTEVLMADNALREAQQSNLSAIVDYLKVDLELKKLTGNISQQKN
ncbi:TolC family protein [uncultured Draconibacterium sp.]|uniref:TolC family protein n=1 Tax=uncultured Draconibacterium sp. TaxID=1573823 RepID=UPI0025CF6942|nr:TolC family protein [uncultured Draconibacterium sp.]